MCISAGNAAQDKFGAVFSPVAICHGQAAKSQHSAFCIQSGHQHSKYSLYPGKQAEVVKNKTSWSAKLDTFISFAHTDDPSFLQYGFFMGSSSILTVAHTLRAATDWPPFSTLMVRSLLFVTLKPMHSFSQIFATLSLDVELHDEI